MVTFIGKKRLVFPHSRQKTILRECKRKTHKEGRLRNGPALSLPHLRSDQDERGADQYNRVRFRMPVTVRSGCLFRKTRSAPGFLRGRGFPRGLLHVRSGSINRFSRQLPQTALQCTHHIVSSLRKLTPLVLKGVNLCNRLTVNCVRCSAKWGAFRYGSWS